MRSNILFILILWCGVGVNAAPIVLSNEQWQVELEPETLAIQVKPNGQTKQVVSIGSEPKAVANLNSEVTKVEWSWAQERYWLTAVLEGTDLQLTIAAQQPDSLLILNQPPAAIGQGLILPLAEGYYIPANNAQWQTFLLSEMATINTTQDLSLPLWAVDYGSYTLSWLLLNPYNNQLQFYQSSQTPLGINLTHQFTSMDYQTPMKLVLHLGSQDPLAGSKRYRRWLIDNELFDSFTAKVQVTPSAAKLAGATHTYLWGSDLLAINDVVSWPQLLKTLRSTSAFTSILLQQFEPEASKLVKSSVTTLDRYQKKVIITAINQSLNFQARAEWQTKEPDLDRLVASYSQLRQRVAETFGTALTADPALWGAGVSMQTIRQLQQAGLTRLWIGIGEGWEGGLWHPEAIAEAVKAGYLIAPYDSYQTALPLSSNPDWTTAHLGEKVYQTCQIIQADGTVKAGFQKQGHYTTPDCVRPWLEQRVTKIQQQAGFNSWFLDAYATGMVFDNYQSEYSLSQQHYAEGNIKSLRWVNDILGIPVGSEDGNAVTARGVFFAHGMQTPVIGWGDKALTQPRSPYYLGRWYPSDEPSIFFKSSAMKEPLRTLYFDPVNRLPLYQSVFHDAVITSHHWLFDSLKLNNVLAENQLTQLLYNVPGLYNLSQGTLISRIAVMVKQDQFFRPLHQRLVTEALQEFHWLSEDRLIQQTVFADGTRLIANFRQESEQYQSMTLPALSVTAIHPDHTISRFIVKN